MLPPITSSLVRASRDGNNAWHPHCSFLSLGAVLFMALPTWCSSTKRVQIPISISCSTADPRADGGSRNGRSADQASKDLHREQPDPLVQSSGTTFTRSDVCQACLHCKARKRRCDGKTPACTNCIAHGAECNYAPVRKTRGPGKR